MTLETLELRQSHLEQVPAGTGLPELAERVEGVWQAAGQREESARGVVLLVDVTASGGMLPELLGRRAPVRMTVTGGFEARFLDGGVCAVPRVDLANALLLATQRDRFRTSGALPLAETFRRALQGFAMRPPARGDDELEAARREAEDDLVVAAAMCAWWAAREVPDRRGATIDPRRSGIGDYDPHAALERW